MAHVRPSGAQPSRVDAAAAGPRIDQQQEFDVTKLAPRLKGTHDVGKAVLSAPAKRSREVKAQDGPYASGALVCHCYLVLTVR